LGCQVISLEDNKQGEEMSIMRTDIGDSGGHSDFNARVAFLRQLSLEEFVQFSIEDTVSDELAALGDGTLCSSHDCRLDDVNCQKGTMQIIWTDSGHIEVAVAAKGFDKV
jgi:hypothetical protein